MIGLPPWLLTTPADFLRASEAGANLGLRAGEARIGQQNALARQALAEQELGQRQTDSSTHTALAYAHLAQEQERQKMAMQAEQAHAASVLQQRQQSMEFLNRYREENMQRQREQAGAAGMLRLAEINKPHIIPIAGGGVVSVDPASGELTTLREPTAKASTKKTQAQATEEFDLKQQIASLNTAIKATPVDDAKVLAGDKLEIAKKDKVAGLRYQREMLMNRLSLIGQPSPELSPVMGKRQEADEASMAGKESAAASLSDEDNSTTTSSGKRYTVTPTK